MKKSWLLVFSFMTILGILHSFGSDPLDTSSSDMFIDEEVDISWVCSYRFPLESPSPSSDSSIPFCFLSAPPSWMGSLQEIFIEISSTTLSITFSYLNPKDLNHNKFTSFIGQIFDAASTHLSYIIPTSWTPKYKSSLNNKDYSCVSFPILHYQKANTILQSLATLCNLPQQDQEIFANVYSNLVIYLNQK